MLSFKNQVFASAAMGCAMVLASVAVASAATVTADTSFQNGGNYNADANWTGSSVPSGVVADIASALTATVSDTVSVSPSTLYIGNATGGTLEVTAGGSLALTNLYIGNDGGAGTLTISGGSFTTSGLYAQLGGSDSDTAGGGDCTVTQTGGDVLFNGARDEAFQMGFSTNYTTTYTISGGTLKTGGVKRGDFQIGRYGNAIFSQEGGTVDCGGWLSIGRNTGGNGVYNLSGGTLNALNSSTALTVGEYDTGVFNLSDNGVANVNGMRIAHKTTGAGTVNITGGSLNIMSSKGIFQGDGSSTFNLSGGLLDMNGYTIGALDTFSFTGGTILDAGTIAFSLAQEGGILAPGADGSTGTTAISGDYTQTDGTLLIDLLNTSSVDKLSVSSSAAFSGMIEVSLLAGASVNMGDIFDIVDAMSITNNSLTWSLPELQSGMTWDTSSFTTDGTIRVVPEPATLTLLLLGVSGLLYFAWRKRK